MATFNLENYLENSRKVDLSEFDFSRAREHSLTPDEIRCLEYMMDVESSTIVYLRAVLRTCVIDDPEAVAIVMRTSSDVQTQLARTKRVACEGTQQCKRIAGIPAVASER